MSVTTSGLQSKSGNRITRSIIEVLSSMRFAIALLVILSIASIIGTVLTQSISSARSGPTSSAR
jgi:cytochrome c biogenesis protein